MYIGYEPSHEAFYDNKGKLLKPELAKAEYRYPLNYVMGPFTNIFLPTQTNIDISGGYDGSRTIPMDKTVEPLLHKLVYGNSVCFIAYGTSGSGKTYSLVHGEYVDKKTKKIIQDEGLLIRFCENAMITSNYDFLDVEFVELIADVKASNEKLGSEQPKIYPDMADAKDEIRDFYGKNTFSRLENHEWKLKEGPSIGKKIDNVEMKENETGLGSFIVEVMNKKRVVRATTNNPESSRSHMIIFVKFKRDASKKDRYKELLIKEGLLKESDDEEKFDKEFSKEPYLIICDFAGVENRFNCEDPYDPSNDMSVLRAFEIIKKCTTKDANNICTAEDEFYGKEIREKEDEVVNNISTTKATKDAALLPLMNMESTISKTESLLIRESPVFPYLSKKGMNNIIDTYIDTALKIIVPFNETSLGYYDIDDIPVTFTNTQSISDNPNYSKFKILDVISREINNVDIKISNPSKFKEDYINYSNTDEITFTNIDSVSPIFLWLGPKSIEIWKKTSEIVGTKRQSSSPTVTAADYLDPINAVFNYSKANVPNMYKISFKKSLDVYKNELYLLFTYIVYSIRNKYRKKNLPVMKDLLGRRDTDLEKIKKEMSDATSSGVNRAKEQKLQEICKERVREGVFINKSLFDLRKFISYFLISNVGANSKVLNPRFTNICAPIQCNPYYEDCFGSSAINEMIEDGAGNEPQSHIADEIKTKL